jgi:pyruvate formate lyase activating enzyme
MKINEVLKEIMADADFYRNSDGGVTVSGGEALVQADFVAALMRACREQGIHTTLDTTGFSPWEKLSGVLEYTDLVLFDIKHLDPLKHREATGVGNQLILKNLLALAGEKRLWLRMPVIPGYNDSCENILAVADLCKSIRAERLSLLPYHEGGKSKSSQIGKTFAFPEGRVPSDEHMSKLRELAGRDGLTVTIGS